MSSESSLATKLQIKEGRKVLLINPPKGYQARLGELPAGVEVLSSPSEEADIIQVFVENRKELEAQLPRIKAFVQPKGMIWVTYHKGTSKVKTDIHRDSINDYAKNLGLTGVAMISIDEDWSALRLKVTD
jgi:hypothetical protein